jgi:hypothetical protein
MQHWIIKFQDDATAFCGGLFSGSIFGVPILGIEWHALIIQAPLKVFMAVTVSFMGGIAGLAAKDFYYMLKEWYKNKYQKK